MAVGRVSAEDLALAIGETQPRISGYAVEYQGRYDDVDGSANNFTI
jgi:hypothetical protein